MIGILQSEHNTISCHECNNLFFIIDTEADMVGNINNMRLRKMRKKSLQ